VYGFRPEAFTPPDSLQICVLSERSITPFSSFMNTSVFEVLRGCRSTATHLPPARPTSRVPTHQDLIDLIAPSPPFSLSLVVLDLSREIQWRAIPKNHLFSLFSSLLASTSYSVDGGAPPACVLHLDPIVPPLHLSVFLCNTLIVFPRFFSNVFVSRFVVIPATSSWNPYPAQLFFEGPSRS